MPKKPSNEQGFGMAELIVVVAIIAIIAAAGVPSLVTYWQSSRLTAGAEQLASVMNRGRQLAIRSNTSVCVERTGTNVRLRTGSCAGTIWTGVGTDSAGLIKIANDLQVGGATNAIFTNVGGASTTATYSLTDTKSGRSRNVVVAATGRVTIQ
jgi:prepilin-type N-terminal cleavage/methylation domain-containing protein